MKFNINRLTTLFTKALKMKVKPQPEIEPLSQPQKDLLENYKPTLFLTHPFLQSIYNLAEPKITMSLYKERIFFTDGGHVSLNWVTDPRNQQLNASQNFQNILENSELTNLFFQNKSKQKSSPTRKNNQEKNLNFFQSHYYSLFSRKTQGNFQFNINQGLNMKFQSSIPAKKLKNTKKAKSPPILFLMHGLTGGSQNNYIKALMMEAAQEGYICVCMNSRGIDNEMTSPIPFTGVSHYQLQVALKRVRIYYPDSEIYLVGTSFGGNYLIRYLLKSYQKSLQNKNAQRQENSSNLHETLKNIKGLVALAPPFSITDCVDDMSAIYQKFFVKRYVDETVRKHPIMKYWGQIGLVDMQKVYKAQNLRDFHSQITAKVLGMSGAEEVFDNLNVKKNLIEKGIKIPTLIMTSKDDPIVSYRSFPLQQIGKNENIQLVTTQRGGHMCWFEGILPKRWYPKPTLNFFRKIMNNNQV